MKYLPLYHEWARHGKIPENGLCNIFIGDPIFALIDPENGTGETYWGYDGNETEDCQLPPMVRWYEFTPMRQNVVLLMAAMAGEL